MSDWDLVPGDELRRDERMRRFGGGKQGGIEESARTPNVFIYSDRDRGAAYGYDFDGWDEEGGSFFFTGDGQELDQRFVAGNAAVRAHVEHRRQLRVFIADGFVLGTRTRRQIYIGEFAIDPVQPFEYEQAPDRNHEMRSVIVFRLRPVGSVLFRPEDVRRMVGSAEGGEMARAPERVDPEAHNVSEFDRPPVEGGLSRRVESDLVVRFTAHLTSLGHVVSAYRIPVLGEPTSLRIDLYDETTSELYEAKGVTSRGSIRYAVGQLLDYRRRMPPSSLAVLLPAKPTIDLIDLLHGVGISCVFEDLPGRFDRLDPRK